MFADDMLLYMEKSKHYTKNLLELTDQFSKVTGYKINIQNSSFFMLMMNLQKEKSRKKSHLQQPQQTKYLGV